MQTPEINLTLLGLAFSRALNRPFNDACGGEWKTVVSESAVELPTDSHDAVCFRFTFAGDFAGQAFLTVERNEVRKLWLHSVNNDEGAYGEEHANALLSVCQAATSELSELLKEQGAVTIQAERAAGSDLPDEYALELYRQAQDPNHRVAVVLLFDRQLVTSLQATSAKPFAYPSAAEGTTANLGLVMDVELNVTLRFGQRRLPLREVLDLTSGSVVELDRQVDEPVELVLDGRVVARGEAVIIDGNYGMRITQVVHQFVP
jgi:flagellar motor switch protein FliN/FliY